jgi:hypothetical protein
MLPILIAFARARQTVSDEATHVAVITFDDTATLVTDGYASDSAVTAAALDDFVQVVQISSL